MTREEVFELLKTTDKKFWHMDYFGRYEYIQGYDSAVRKIRGIHYYRKGKDGELFREIILLSKFLTKFSDPMWKDGWVEFSTEPMQSFSCTDELCDKSDIDPSNQIEISKIKPSWCPIGAYDCAGCKYLEYIHVNEVTKIPFMGCTKWTLKTTKAVNEGSKP